MLKQLYFVCEGVLQCNVRFDAENLNVAISPTAAVQVEKGGLTSRACGMTTQSTSLQGGLTANAALMRPTWE